LQRLRGKQYRASKGEVLKLEKLDADEGASVKFDEVLLVGEGSNIKVGSPLLAGSTVSAKVLRQGKSKKVSVVKFRRRKNYLRQHTHRQFFTEVEITGITGAGKAPAAPKEEAAKEPAAKKAAAKKPAAKKPAAKKPAAKKAAAKKPSTKKNQEEGQEEDVGAASAANGLNRHIHE
jgi:large subunit ribosomal protein L21